MNRQYNETDLWIGRARLGIGNLLLLRVLAEVQNTLIHPPVSITSQNCNILYSKIYPVTITVRFYVYFSLVMYHIYSKIANSTLNLEFYIPGQRYWFDVGVVKGGKRDLCSIGRPPERGG